MTGQGDQSLGELAAPPPRGLCIPPGAPSPTGGCAKPRAALGLGGRPQCPCGHPLIPASPRPAGEHGHWDPGVQQTCVQGRYHRQEAEGAGRVGLGSCTAPYLSRDDTKPPPPPSRSGDGGTEPLTEQGLHKFSEAMKPTASQDPRPAG